MSEVQNTPDHGQEQSSPGVSRRGLLRNGALLGGLAALAGGLPAGTAAAATTSSTSAVPRAGARSAQGTVDIPNKYGKPFSVDDDELFIFAVNFKPFELGGDDAGRESTRYFDTVFGDAIRAKFPAVKIKYATWDYPIRYEDLARAGRVPDLIIEDPRTRIDRDLEPLGWVADLTADLQRAGIDLSTLNPSTVELVKSRSDGGLYGVPLFIDEHVLLYNKQIFDKFGSRYPKVGSTYDEIYQTARKLTRQDGIDHYKGFMQHPDNYLALNQAGLYPFVPGASEQPAPEDVKVNLTSAEWKSISYNMNRFLQLPGNTFTTVDDFFKGDMSFPGHLAMAVHTLSKLNAYALSDLYVEEDDAEQFAEWAKSVTIGVTSMPVLSRGSTAIYQPNTRAAFVPPQSAHKDQALEIVKYLISEEAQTRISSYGVKGVLATDAVKAAFGTAIPELKNIDTSAVYWGDNAVVKNYQNTEYWDIPLYKVFRQHVLIDGMDVDSALQVAEQLDIPNYIKAQAAAGFTW
ncbi:multiple sugar transport system substrate-binding protein [Kribbella amoyensis]|uniref:Multiple sugar transport system substrate-binding protein n=1 Tax=Kribbella amoyensis TaxID=996641 RepID=A0A561B8S6_9ACTN|nr:extracellular solute-binding protein [Kribbella amoyensis]TWD75167.1 multiple sugar transport system substrate-binding protein [Kribbella amoyensis]